MNTIGSVCLRVIGEKLDFNCISNNLNIQPTNVYKKGEIRKYGKSTFQSENDSWIYEIKFGESEDISATLEKLINILLPHKDYIKILSENSEAIIRCYLSSDYAQIYASFSSEVIKKIAELDVIFEISVLSFGGVE